MIFAKNNKNLMNNWDDLLQMLGELLCQAILKMDRSVKSTAKVLQNHRQLPINTATVGKIVADFTVLVSL